MFVSLLSVAASLLLPHILLFYKADCTSMASYVLTLICTYVLKCLQFIYSMGAP